MLLSITFHLDVDVSKTSARWSALRSAPRLEITWIVNFALKIRNPLCENSYQGLCKTANMSYYFLFWSPCSTYSNFRLGFVYFYQTPTMQRGLRTCFLLQSVYFSLVCTRSYKLFYLSSFPTCFFYKHSVFQSEARICLSFSQIQP